MRSSAWKRIDCAGPQEEAAPIALLVLRARRVRNRASGPRWFTPGPRPARGRGAELKALDKSTSTIPRPSPLDQTPPARFLRLTAECCGGVSAPVPLLAALEASSWPPGGLESRGHYPPWVRRFEMAACAAREPAPAFVGLKSDSSAKRRRIRDRLDRPSPRLAAPLDRLDRPAAVSARRSIYAHVGFAEGLARATAKAARRGCGRAMPGAGRPPPSSPVLRQAAVRFRARCRRPYPPC
jgi:hypothetical protein